MNFITIFLFVVFTTFLLSILWFLTPFFHNLSQNWYIPKSIFLVKKILISLILIFAIFGYFWIFFGEDNVFQNANFDISKEKRLDF